MMKFGITNPIVFDSLPDNFLFSRHNRKTIAHNIKGFGGILRFLDNGSTSSASIQASAFSPASVVWSATCLGAAFGVITCDFVRHPGAFLRHAGEGG